MTGNLADYPSEILHGARVLTPAKLPLTWCKTSIREAMSRRRIKWIWGATVERLVELPLVFRAQTPISISLLKGPRSSTG